MQKISHAFSDFSRNPCLVRKFFVKTSSYLHEMTTNSTISLLLRLHEMELVSNANNPLLVVATALRLLFSAVWIVVTLIFTRVLLRKKVFHVNVQCLLIALPTSYAVIIVPNTALQATIQFNVTISDEAHVTLTEITSIGIFGTTFNLFAFVFERLIASLLVHRYEHISARIPLISLFMLVLQWTGASICIALNYAGTLTLLPLLIIVGVEWAISVVMFSFLPWFSRRAYEKVKQNNDMRYRIRYQSVENVRTALVLNRLVLFLATAILLLLSYYTWMSYWMPPELFNLLNQYFHVICAILPSIACVIVLLNHGSLKKDLGVIFTLGLRERRIGTESTTMFSDGPQVQIRSISGMDLVIPQERHHDHYFKELRTQWN